MRWTAHGTRAEMTASIVRRLLSTAPLSPRALASAESSLLDRLRALPHPTLPCTLGGAVSSVALTAVPGGASLEVVLRPLSPAAPSAAAQEALVRAAAAAELGAGVLRDVRVRIAPALGAPRAFASLAPASAPGLGLVRSAIAVASGKGGVGKSAVAVNLAYALAARGCTRVGLLDADVYGPSLPTMVSPSSLEVHKDAPTGTINALHYRGVSCMSYGWVAPRGPSGERGGALMRGPLVSQVISQLVRFTAWGALDHLVVDTPPGTGDVHITLGQALPLTGAVIVTTPQALAMVDAKKGLDMFAALRVRPLALVLNMAHLTLPGGGRLHPFGDGDARALALMSAYGIPSHRLYRIPIDPALSAAGDAGVPLVASDPHGEVGAVFEALARGVAEDCEAELWKGLQPQEQSSSLGGGDGAVQGVPGSLAVQVGDLHVSFRPAQLSSTGPPLIVLRRFRDDGAEEATLSPLHLRCACKCAGCVDEVTGAPRLDPSRVPTSIVPTSLAPQGNYGIAVTWSDKHASSIFSTADLWSLTMSSRS